MKNHFNVKYVSFGQPVSSECKRIKSANMKIGLKTRFAKYAAKVFFSDINLKNI